MTPIVIDFDKYKAYQLKDESLREAITRCDFLFVADDPADLDFSMTKDELEEVHLNNCKPRPAVFPDNMSSFLWQCLEKESLVTFTHKVIDDDR